MKGRERAGRVMLRIIFDLLTTWNQPNVENFFILLRQFFVTYCCPLLHDGKERPWGLPYGEEQVHLRGYIPNHISRHFETADVVFFGWSPTRHLLSQKK